MLKFIPANKTEHPRFAIRIGVKDWDPCIRVASPYQSGELVAQGAHRVRVPDVDHVHLAICLQREPWSGKGEEEVERYERTTSLTVTPPHRYWCFAFRYGSWESLNFHEYINESLISRCDILNHEFVDAFRFEGVGYGLGNEDSQHDWHSIRESVRQLEHDHRQ